MLSTIVYLTVVLILINNKQTVLSFVQLNYVWSPHNSKLLRHEMIFSMISTFSLNSTLNAVTQRVRHFTVKFNYIN